MSHRHTRLAALISTVLLTLAGLTACGDEEQPAVASGDPVVIDISVDGDEVTPNGDRVEVSLGAPIELVVTADAPGEIHVHSTPEQEFEYAAGETTLDLSPVTRPGIVDIESHTLEKTIVQLEVQ